MLSTVFRQVTIIAPGLLGASLGMAIRERNLAARIVVWARRSEARAACLSKGWCDDAPESLAEAVTRSDLLVFCTPVAQIVPLVRIVADYLAEDALLTDVGSTKGLICGEAPPILSNGPQFVGAHPMAGSEKSGMEHASSTLFDGCPCFITPHPGCPEEAISKVESFWQAVGMRTVRETPARHDEIVAHVSHLPHLIASILSVALSRDASGCERFAGAGLRDTTRVAAGNPAMWRAICEQNRGALLAAIADFKQALYSCEKALQSSDFAQVENFLEEGQRYRQRLDHDRHD